MRPRLTSITLRGYKTIQRLDSFEPGSITILIGPNGAGKSNFISFFRFLSWALVPPGQLQTHIAEVGGASAILHVGETTTREMETILNLTTELGVNEYSFRLFHAAGDTLVFADEWFRFQRHGRPRSAISLGAGHKESQLFSKSTDGDRTAETADAILKMLRRIIVHQFHNTSSTARIRNKWDLNDGRWLKEDAGNLAAFLFRLQQMEPKYYDRIVNTIRLILPFFAAFEFNPEYGKVLLQWRELGSDHVFSAHQAADGMLRIMALVALLQQPERDLPDVLVLDEPELGLHPYAIHILASLIKSVSTHTQIVVATQSVSLIDRFDPENIVVVSRAGRESKLRRLGSHEFEEWLGEYTLSELWEKNVLGGRPSH